MQPTKKGRGRPRGSGCPDEPTLDAVADLLVANPALRPTAAMRRVLPHASGSDIRRLQVKWKGGSSVLLQNAQTRATAKSEANVSSIRPGRSGRAATIDPYTAARLATDLQDSPAMRAICDLQNNGSMQAIRDHLNSPAMQAIRDFQNSPTMRAMRDFENSPAGRAIREMQSNPALRAILEQQELIDRFRRGL